MNVKNVLYILSGITIGAGGMYLHMKRKIDEANLKAESEIREMREYYNKLISNASPEKKEEEEPESNDEKESQNETVETKINRMTEYNKIVNNLGYSGKEENLDPYNDGFDEDGNALPYIITPDEFGDLPGYDVDELTLYADGYLTDSNDDLVENIDEKIGVGTLDKIGEYEPDILHVRNEKYEMDFEILRVQDKYESIAR